MFVNFPKKNIISQEHFKNSACLLDPPLLQNCLALLMAKILNFLMKIFKLANSPYTEKLSQLYLSLMFAPVNLNIFSPPNRSVRDVVYPKHELTCGASSLTALPWGAVLALAFVLAHSCSHSSSSSQSHTTAYIVVLYISTFSLFLLGAPSPTNVFVPN